VARRKAGLPATAPPGAFRWWPRVALVVLALGCAVAPMPARTVERIYSREWYPALQPILTSISSLVPIAFLDLLILALASWAALRVVPAVRTPRGARRQAIVRALASLAAGAAVLYLTFLALWGLNYRRVPLAAQLDFARDRVTRASVQAVATRSVTEINRLYVSAHADPAATLTLQAVRTRLAPAFAQTQRDLGWTRLATPARPKYSLLSPFFRWATVDGMVNPFGLEVLVNPDVLPIERPFVIAHEWAHLAGWARESEASYVGWLTCLNGDGAARYSAWTSLYLHLRADVSREMRARLDGALAAGPRGDFQAIRVRLERGLPVVQRASWQAYDKFLKANRVDEGVRSYDEVVTLVVGTATNEEGKPRLRR
jgi:hypothetical protein